MVVRSRAWVLALAVLFAAGGCVTVTPGGPPTPTVASALPGATATRPPAPGRSRRPRVTPTPGLQTATATSTDPATEPPSAPPTAPPTDTPTLAPTATVAPPTSTATFDYSADPNYGSVDLAAGFTPDPHRIPTLSGGSVSASYLGGDCTGYATVEPDHEVDYSYQGGPALLRFYFVANDTNEDTTLIINATDASWHCSDDTYGTKNPTVDFPNPAAGTYDIWIGSYASGTNISGTLYITELDSNHP